MKTRQLLFLGIMLGLILTGCKKNHTGTNSVDLTPQVVGTYSGGLQRTTVHLATAVITRQSNNSVILSFSDSAGQFYREYSGITIQQGAIGGIQLTGIPGLFGSVDGNSLNLTFDGIGNFLGTKP